MGPLVRYIHREREREYRNRDDGVLLLLFCFKSRRSWWGSASAREGLRVWVIAKNGTRERCGPNSGSVAAGCAPRWTSGGAQRSGVGKKRGEHQGGGRNSLA